MINLEKPLEFENRIANILKKAAIPFKRNWTIGGVKPDFLIKTSDGRNIVLEAKALVPSQINQSRAIKRVDLFQKNIGADRAFVVFPYLKQAQSARGIVAAKNLADILSTEFKIVLPPPPKSIARQSPATSEAKKIIFAAMPFDSKYDDVFYVAMAGAAKAVNGACIRVDHEVFSDEIVPKIKDDIRKSVAVIADLSESKPNVLYEIGFANAIGRPTIHICSTSLKKLPFDVRNYPTISYKVGQTYKLKDDLEKALRDLLK